MIWRRWWRGGGGGGAAGSGEASAQNQVGQDPGDETNGAFSWQFKSNILNSRFTDKLCVELPTVRTPAQVWSHDPDTPGTTTCYKRQRRLKDVVQTSGKSHNMNVEFLSSTMNLMESFPPTLQQQTDKRVKLSSESRLQELISARNTETRQKRQSDSSKTTFLLPADSVSSRQTEQLLNVSM